jgi:hypothetical protein
VYDFCGLQKCLASVADKKTGGRYFMVSLWASVLVDMIKRELDKQESREDEIIEALRNVKILAEKSAVSEFIAEVDDYITQLNKEDYNDKKYFFSIFLWFLCIFVFSFVIFFVSCLFSLINFFCFLLFSLCRAKKEVMLVEVPKWEAKYRDPINNAFKPKAASNEGMGTMSSSADDDRRTAVNPDVPVYRLSDEILVGVFSHLATGDLRNAGQVSQLFRRVSHDKTLWPILTGEGGAGGKKKLDIAFCVDNTGSMGSYIKRYTHARVLERKVRCGC